MTDELPFIRRALYAGVMSSAGATLGWILWIFALALWQNPGKVLKASITGAIIALLLHLFEAYRRSGQSGPAPVLSSVVRETWLRRTARFGRNLLVAVFFVMLLIVRDASENFVADVAPDIYRPLLASIITLFPIGVVFACGLHSPWTVWLSVTPAALFVVATLLGYAAAAVAGGVYLLLDEPVPPALVGWWWLVALVLALGLLLARRHRPLSLLAVAVVPLVVLASAAEPRSARTERASSWNGSLVRVSAYVYDSLLTAPDVPAAFWKDAEAKLNLKRAARIQARGMTHPGFDLLAGWIGCVPTSDAAPAQTSPRKERMCRELGLGVHSSLVRSLFVVACFVLGFALTSPVERRLRPDNYHASRMRIHDVRIFAGIACTLFVIALGLRFYG